MKIFLLAAAVTWLLPGMVLADPALCSQNDQEGYVNIENLSYGIDDQIVYPFLFLDPFSLSDDKETTWHYYVIHSEPAKIRILNAFLPHLQQFHRHSKLPFSAVADYWEKIFKEPIQIFVFGEDKNQSEHFCTSHACEKIVTTARILGLRFMWNGALNIAEADIKQILDVPAEYSLITTIFLQKTETQEVSRAQQ
ncbi:nitroreductase family protein [candidate division WOR-3 bacterium]|nr:nitroreductase family protein [candidate division WOR-3 bacterium]